MQKKESKICALDEIFELTMFEYSYDEKYESWD